MFLKMKGFLNKFSGFPPCDSVGGTLKRLSTHASLQRPFSEQILTAKQFFEFANSEITGVTTYFVNSQFVKENVPFLVFKLQHLQGNSQETVYSRWRKYCYELCFCVLPKIYLCDKKKLFYLLSTSCQDCFMLVLMMMSGTLVLQTTFQ